MKKIVIVAVGKIKEAYLKEGINEYLKRLTRFAEVKIIEIADYPSGDVAINKESECILRATEKIDFLLDIKGEQLSSEELSLGIEQLYLQGNNEVVFVIGGSGGVNNEVKSKAVRRISFGRITYPHQLMRLILTEQLYRAFSIANCLPYHK